MVPETLSERWETRVSNLLAIASGRHTELCSTFLEGYSGEERVIERGFPEWHEWDDVDNSESRVHTGVAGEIDQVDGRSQKGKRVSDHVWTAQREDRSVMIRIDVNIKERALCRITKGRNTGVIDALRYVDD
jgi:hypothetical protein